MATPRQEQLGSINILDKDKSGSVDFSEAAIENSVCVKLNPQSSSLSSNSLWFKDGTVSEIVFTNSDNEDIYLGNARYLKYDNTSTNISSTNIQDAIDEVYFSAVAGGKGFVFVNIEDESEYTITEQSYMGISPTDTCLYISLNTSSTGTVTVNLPDISQAVVGQIIMFLSSNRELIISSPMQNMQDRQGDLNSSPPVSSITVPISTEGSLYEFVWTGWVWKVIRSGNRTPITAQSIFYDNSSSTLIGQNVQTAIDEVNNKIDSIVIPGAQGLSEVLSHNNSAGNQSIYGVDELTAVDGEFSSYVLTPEIRGVETVSISSGSILNALFSESTDISLAGIGAVLSKSSGGHLEYRTIKEDYTLEDVLQNGSDAGGLNITNVGNISAINGNFSNNVNVSGDVFIDGTQLSAGVVFNLQGSSPHENSPTNGSIWVRNDGRLIFTDNENVDHELQQGLVSDYTLKDILENGNDAGENSITNVSNISAVSGDYSGNVSVSGILSSTQFIESPGIFFGYNQVRPENPAAGFGSVWINNSGDLVFTDESGTDYILNPAIIPIDRLPGNIPVSKLQDSGAGNTLLGRAAASGGVRSDIAIPANSLVGRSGSGNIGSISFTSGALPLTILNNAAAYTVAARPSGTAGVRTDVAVGEASVIGRLGSGDISSIPISSIASSQDLESVLTAGNSAGNNSITNVSDVSSGTITINGPSSSSATISLKANGDLVSTSGGTEYVLNPSVLPLNRIPTIPANKLANSSAFSLFGRPGSGSGVKSDISIDADALVGRAGSGNIGSIAKSDLNLPLASLSSAPGYSVLGKATTGAGARGDITIGANSTLVRSGSGNISSLSIGADSVLGRDGSGNLTSVGFSVINSKNTLSSVLSNGSNADGRAPVGIGALGFGSSQYPGQVILERSNLNLSARTEYVRTDLHDDYRVLFTAAGASYPLGPPEIGSLRYFKRTFMVRSGSTGTNIYSEVKLFKTGAVGSTSYLYGDGSDSSFFGAGINNPQGGPRNWSAWGEATAFIINTSGDTRWNRMRFLCRQGWFGQGATTPTSISKVFYNNIGGSSPSQLTDRYPRTLIENNLPVFLEEINDGSTGTPAIGIITRGANMIITVKGAVHTGGVLPRPTEW